MSRAQKISHQWLSTDAALGAAEVPLPARLLAASPKRSDPSGAVRPAAATLRAPAGTPAARSAAAPPVLHQSVATSRPMAKPPTPTPAKPAIRVASIPAAASLPPIPQGHIADQPGKSPQEKAQLLAELAGQVDQAMAPYLCDVATRVVFGEGDPAAQLLFVGEGPGAEEDRTGRPFVGRSGQLLDKMIVAMGLSREKVYIANICKLRAADWDQTSQRMKDRPPTVAEAALGIPWLHRQIAIIAPKVIVTLGASAIRHLIGETENMTTLRGHWRQYRGIPLMPTYHPSFVLRAYNLENRAKVWSDLQAVLTRLKQDA